MIMKATERETDRQTETQRERANSVGGQTIEIFLRRVQKL